MSRSRHLHPERFIRTFHAELGRCRKAIGEYKLTVIRLHDLRQTARRCRLPWVYLRTEEHLRAAKADPVGREELRRLDAQSEAELRRFILVLAEINFRCHG